MQEIIDECKVQMEKRLENLERDLNKARTGRASVALLDNVKVEYYGVPTPLNQVASLSTPDARTIMITPFEKKSIAAIEKSIHMADIGIQPTNDGNTIRLPIPQLSEDRRKEIAKSVKKTGEDAKIGVRKVRQDTNNKIKKLEKAKELNEDDSKSLQKDIQTLTDGYVKKVDERIEKSKKIFLPCNLRSEKLLLLAQLFVQPAFFYSFHKSRAIQAK